MTRPAPLGIYAVVDPVSVIRNQRVVLVLAPAGLIVRLKALVSRATAAHGLNLTVVMKHGSASAALLVKFAAQMDVATTRELFYALILIKSIMNKNYEAMQVARNANKALLENLSFLPDDIDMLVLEDVSYASLCVGCTDPKAANYDPLAEVDNNTCL